MFRLNDLIGCPVDQVPPEPKVTMIYPVPFGYRFESGRFVVEAAEQAAIRRMRALRKRGFSMRQIAEVLTDEGVPTKRNAPRWSKTTVGRILNGQGAMRATACAQTGESEPAAPVGRRLPRVTPAPYGYRARIHKLVADRAEQQTIRRMRIMRTAGASYRDIAKRLDAAGVRAPRAAHWRPDTVRRILATSGPLRTRVKSGPTDR